MKEIDLREEWSRFHALRAAYPPPSDWDGGGELTEVAAEIRDRFDEELGENAPAFVGSVLIDLITAAEAERPLEMRRAMKDLVREARAAGIAIILED